MEAEENVSAPSQIGPVFTLLELTQLVEGVIDQVFSDRLFWLQAEISEVYWAKERRYARITLTEMPDGGRTAVASLSAFIWKGQLGEVARFESQAGIPLQKGIQVLVRVSVRFSKIYGLSLQVHQIDASHTIGQLSLKKQAVVEELIDTYPDVVGLDDNGKLYSRQQAAFGLRRVFRRVALVSSRDGQGMQDFEDILRQQADTHGFRFDITLFDTLVQGEQAPIQIARRLAEIAARAHDFDLVVIVRGGGASTDLLAFDDFEVCAQIAIYPLPVMTGIGHTRDQAIADMLAFGAYNTPSRVAQVLIDHHVQLESYTLSLANNIQLWASQSLALKREELDSQVSYLKTAVIQLVQSGKDQLGLLKSSISQSSLQSQLLFRKQLTPYSQRLVLYSQQWMRQADRRLALVQQAIPLHVQYQLENHRIKLAKTSQGLSYLKNRMASSTT